MSAFGSSSSPRAIPVRYWWRIPFWALALATGAKSFVDNPVLGSRWLNRRGLHAARARLAHALAASRRRRLAAALPVDLREQFDRNGFILIKNVLPKKEFAELRQGLLGAEFRCRSHLQGDTLTSRVPVGTEMLDALPALRSLLGDRVWRSAMAYVSTFKARPLYYLQAIAGGISVGPPDPQIQLHADTFHPSMKSWLFLTDVDENDRPLTYVAGSHVLTPQRLAWERRLSQTVLDSDDRLSQRGSFRVSAEDLAEMGLPEPTRFCVDANTLVVVDTCGFHARSDSPRSSLRVELWAYSRRSPFIPWLGLDLFTRFPRADGRAEWLAQALDWLDRLGWAKQHWKRAKPWNSVVAEAKATRLTRQSKKS